MMPKLLYSYSAVLLQGVVTTLLIAFLFFVCDPKPDPKNTHLDKIQMLRIEQIEKDVKYIESAVNLLLIHDFASRAAKADSLVYREARDSLRLWISDSRRIQ
jgi:hypothetical protein